MYEPDRFRGRAGCGAGCVRHVADYPRWTIGRDGGWSCGNLEGTERRRWRDARETDVGQK